MNFSIALNKVKIGLKLARKGWSGKNMFIFLVNGSTFNVSRPPLNRVFSEGTEIIYQPHIDMCTADGRIVPWLPSQSDLLASDWEVINTKE
jgi:hypothetical protein